MNKSDTLFDLDGNLTGSRKKFYSTTLSSSPVELNNHVNLGSTTSSNYLKEQLGSFLSSSVCYCFHFSITQESIGAGHG